MGHYDDAYEADAKQRAEETLRMAKAEADRLGVTVLEPRRWAPRGVCGDCAGVVYEQPNWGCKRIVCPHRPSR